MMELNAPSFLGAATEIARLRQILVGIEESDERKQALVPQSVGMLRPRLEGFYAEADKVGAKLGGVDKLAHPQAD